MPNPMIGMIGASVGGSVIQGVAAGKAADAQKDAAAADIAFQKETRDLIRKDLSPWREGGQLGQKAYLYEMGLGAAPNINGQAYGGYTKTPGYDFRMEQGQNAIESSAAARGGLYSGAAMRDLNKFGQDYGTSEYDKYLSRIGGISDTGMSAAQMTGNAAQNAAAGVSNALGNMGNAQAAGAVGVGNALSSGLGNGMGVWNYMSQMNAQPQAAAPMASSIRPMSNPFY